MECDIPQLTEPSRNEKSSDENHEISEMKICHKEFYTLGLAAHTQSVRWATIYEYDADLMEWNLMEQDWQVVEYLCNQSVDWVGGAPIHPHHPQQHLCHLSCRQVGVVHHWSRGSSVPNSHYCKDPLRNLEGAGHFPNLNTYPSLGYCVHWFAANVPDANFNIDHCEFVRYGYSGL